MAVYYEVRHASHPEDAKHYTTEQIRKQFLVDGLFTAGDLRLVYSHYDRAITGGVLATSAVKLETIPPLRAEYFLERRELGVMSIAGKGVVTVDGTKYELEKKEVLYVGMGAKDVVFESANAAEPAKFFLLSYPAHQAYPTTKITRPDASPMELGSIDTSNERTVYKYLHAQGKAKSCQLVMGMTELKRGSVWNTMPAHVHDRRMEVYFYFDVPQDGAVLHVMGEPQETRHIFMHNEEAVISPTWSVHCGAGTGAYSFIWGMGGENIDYADMDVVPAIELK